jgi:hypothetical protein
MLVECLVGLLLAAVASDLLARASVSVAAGNARVVFTDAAHETLGHVVAAEHLGLCGGAAVSPVWLPMGELHVASNTAFLDTYAITGNTRFAPTAPRTRRAHEFLAPPIPIDAAFGAWCP